LGPAATDAGEPLDGVTGFADGAGRMFDEVLFDRGAEVIQRAVLSLPADLVQAVDATLEILIEGSLDGTAGQPGKLGDGVVRESLGFQPDHVHLLLDARMRVMVPLIAKEVENVGSERKIAHGRLPTEGAKPPINLGTPMERGNRVTFSRPEYTFELLSVEQFTPPSSAPTPDSAA
jgi:hypothetical protein